MMLYAAWIHERLWCTDDARVGQNYKYRLIRW